MFLTKDAKAEFEADVRFLLDPSKSIYDDSPFIDREGRTLTHRQMLARLDVLERILSDRTSFSFSL